MFPISDETPRRTFPFINYLIVLANIVVFVLQLSAPDFEQFIYQYGFIPVQFKPLMLNSYFFILTSMFMHGGFFHIISNMWFLHIFGDNVEDEIGHFRYLLFYLLGGFAAVFAQYLFASSVSVPMIGASGAVSAVAGAYYVLHKHARIKTLIAFFYIWSVVRLPASVVLGYWFVTQIFSGLGSLASIDINQGGVAFFAHIGGFIFGWLVASIFYRRREF